MKLREISPKPKTVVELLEGHPERWCKGAMFRDKKGFTSISREAVSCCLGGAINLVYGNNNSDQVSRAVGVISSRSQAYGTIPPYNDDSHTTHGMIVAVAREAGI